MIHVVASIQIKPGQKQAFLEAFKAIVPDVLAEKGCLEYAPTVDIDIQVPVQQLNENVVTIVEAWESIVDLQAHLMAPHMQTYRAKVKDLVEAASLKVLQDA
jgi:quinol monooxygenase YgiN